MKVLHIITGLGLGGAEMMLYKLLSSMDQPENTAEVISLSPNDVMGDRISELGIKVHTLDMKGGLPTPKGILKMSRLIKAFQPDVVQTWMYHADLLGGVTAKLVSKSKIVWNIRQGDLEYRNVKLHTYITAKLCAWLSPFVPNAILTNSHKARENHVKVGYKDKKFNVIPNGFDIDLFKPSSNAEQSLRRELGLGTDTKIIGTVGRFHHQKDFKNFVDASKLIAESFPKAHFCMCGANLDTDNDELMTWIKDAGVQEYIHLLGRRDDIYNVVAAFDIFVSSSSCGEAFGNVIGEAMTCGTPCVVTNVGDSAIIVGNTGRVIERENSTLLAEAVIDLLSLSEEEFLEEEKLARERIVENYSLPAIASRYGNFYQQLQK